MIRSFDGTAPDIADSAYVDDAAVLIGDVVVEAGASVWPNTTLRGDHGRIVVGERANVQDNAVLHEDAVLKPDTTVGHCGIVHAATVGEEAIVAAGSVVTGGTEVPPRTLVAGAPAELKTELDAGTARAPAEHYADLGGRYDDLTERID